MKKVLFICKQRTDSYGSNQYVNKSFGLVNSARFVSNYLRELGIESEVQIAIDANDIDRFVTNYNPTHVIIEALWVTPQKFYEILSIPRHQKRTWVVRLHSRIPFIANEGIAFEWICGYKSLMNLANFYIAPNTQEFANDIEQVIGIPSAYLPNMYDVDMYKLHNFPRAKDYSFIDIGCFGAIRPMKNHMAQAIAAVRFADILHRKARFHVNADRVEQKGDQILKNLRAFFRNAHPHMLIEHDWVLHKEFFQKVRTMDIGMQVSMSETFNIVVADFVANDVPIICSNQVSWMPQIFKVDDINSTQEMAQKLNFAYRYNKIGLPNISKFYLRMTTKFAKQAWVKFINET